jgi:hypothetical protein
LHGWRPKNFLLAGKQIAINVIAKLQRDSEKVSAAKGGGSGSGSGSHAIKGLKAIIKTLDYSIRLGCKMGREVADLLI